MAHDSRGQPFERRLSSRSDLDELTELVFAGAAAAANTRLERSIPPTKFSGFASTK